MLDLYRISKCKYIEDTSGEGAFRVGGRWNSKGVRVLYTSRSISLAMLEVLVHTEGLPIAGGMCLGKFKIPSKLIKKISLDDLPNTWADHPSILTTKMIGDDFIKKGKYLALQLPSALIPEEYNFLVNPFHESIDLFELVSIRDFTFDARL